MNLILKIERALAFAKELGMNDNQTKELMALILELSPFKINWQFPNTPNSPPISADPVIYPNNRDTIVTWGDIGHGPTST